MIITIKNKGMIADERDTLVPDSQAIAQRTYPKLDDPQFSMRGNLVLCMTLAAFHNDVSLIRGRKLNVHLSLFSTANKKIPAIWQGKKK